METKELQAKPRTANGKKGAKISRAHGAIPAIVYGHGMEPLPIEVGSREFQQAIHTKAGENVLIQLSVEGVKLKESTCLIKDIQHNPVSDDISHIDFTVVSMTEKIMVQVPLVVQNGDDAMGVREGGVLDIIHHEIEVECTPTQIPEKFEVDVKEMKIGDIVHVKDLNVPEGITLQLPVEEAVITIHAPRTEEEKTETDEEAPTQPEVIEKGKKPEDEEGAAAEEKKAE